MKILFVDPMKDRFLYTLSDNGDVVVKTGEFQNEQEILDFISKNNIDHKNVLIDAGYHFEDVCSLCVGNGFIICKGQFGKYTGWKNTPSQQIFIIGYEAKIKAKDYIYEHLYIISKYYQHMNESVGMYD